MLSDSLGAGVEVLYQSFATQFAGAGNRFQAPVTDAASSNTFMTVAVNGSYTF
jgi:hypothetical protein